MSNGIVKKDRRRDFEAMDWVRDNLAGKVPPEEYGLLLWLAMKCDGNHTCFPGIDTMAKVFGKNERTIRRWLDALESVGLISKKRRRNRSTLYTLNVHSQPDTGVHSSDPDTNVHSGPDMDVHSEPDTDAHLSTTVPLSEEEASVEVVPTTTEEASSVSPGKVDPEKNGKLAALWTPALNDKQTDKLKQLVAFFVEAGLDPAAVIPETLAKWSNVSKALWKEYGDDFNVPKHPKPGYLLGHGPIIVDVLKKQSPPEVSSFW